MIGFLSLAALLAAVCLIAFLLLGRLDTRENRMPDTPRGLRHWLQTYLGINHLHEHIREMEHLMANEVLTLLHGLVAQTTDLTATQEAALSNIHNALTRQEQAIRDLTQQLADAVAGNGKVTPEMQEAANQISTALADLKKAAETADDGFEPVDEPQLPTDPEVPAEPTDPQAPVDPQPEADVPAENARSKRNS